MGGGNSKKRNQNGNEAQSNPGPKYRDIVSKSKIEDCYLAGKQLGAGNMATVYLYTRKHDNKQFAAKIVEKSTLGNPKEFTNELEILAYLKGHSHILELEDVFEDNKKYYLITDLVMGGELFDRICECGQYTEGMAKNMIVPMLQAIQFIHEKQIVHRDIKPENLLLMNKTPDAPLKIADFGVACWLNELALGPNKYLKCGTPEYMAPEMYAGTTAPYGIAVDIWAMGCVVFIMLCGWHPFQDQDSFQKQREAILMDNLSGLETEEISPQAKDFIRKMLIKNPNQRATIPQILKHPWLADASSNNHVLASQQEKLKKYQHLRRLRKVSFAVLAATRASKIGAFNKTNAEFTKKGIAL